MAGLGAIREVHDLSRVMVVLWHAEAARYTGLSDSTLRWQIRNGRLKATKRGRDWMVTRKDLDAYIKNVAK